MSNRFAEIYATNEWGYGSGVGSLPLNNVEYIKFVQAFIQANGVRSVVDLGCGDWQFSQFIDWGGATYLGLDVAKQVIALNKARFGHVDFDVFTGDIPECDLVLCKDVFQHLPNATIERHVALLREKSRFSLVTNDAWPCQELTNTRLLVGDGW